MSRIGRSTLLLCVALVLSSLSASTARAQHGHCVFRDWTVGVDQRRSQTDGYDSDFRRIGLTEYEGDVTGTYISWGFGGIKTTQSAPTLVVSAAVPLALCLVIGLLACGSSMRRRGPHSGSTDE